jgi:carbamoyltransferase
MKNMKYQKKYQQSIYILGYSGLNNSLEFKRKKFSDFNQEELRISQGMDAAAALIKDGKVIAAAEEERYNYQKHSHKFPVNAIKYCLEKEGISINDVSYITHGFDYRYCKKFFEYDKFNKERYNEVYSPQVQMNFLKQYLNIVNPEKIFVPVKHHDAHAASSYYPSGFDNALIIVVDGMGEMYSTSIYKGEGNQIEPLKQYNLLSSLGMFYSMITYHLGFRVNSDEYKVMGLAPYGDYKKYLHVLSRCIEFKDKGEVYIPLLLENKGIVEKESYRGVKNWLNEHVLKSRNINEEITQDHKDIAATLQYLLNKSMFHIITYWQKETGYKKLCLAGGVSLNCTTNGEILKSKLFDDIYIQPAAGDDGTSLGSALYKYYSLNPNAGRVKEVMPFYGHSNKPTEIKNAIKKHSKYIVVEEYPEDALLDRVADLIAQQRVVAWMQGEMEFGPRALGHRSILADPRSPIMKDLINKMVKKRESFRPFAPSVNKERAKDYFDLINSSSLQYMLFTVQVKKKYRPDLPAITHVDGSARIQIVDKETNNLFWKLINTFEKKVGVPILLNTSFNVKGYTVSC